MIRTILVLGVILVGFVLAVLNPYYALLFYTWNAYFRPETWGWSPEYVLMFRVSYAAASSCSWGSS